MNITIISIKRPVTTSMFFLGVVLFGFVSLRELTVDLLPDMKQSHLLVATRFADVSPEEMEILVSAPLEASVSKIPGLRCIESISREGISFLKLEFIRDVDLDFAMLHLRESLDNTPLPEGVEEPVIMPHDSGAHPIMILSLSGQRTLLELKEFSEELVKPRLEQIEGISSAEVVGGEEREVHVTAEPHLLSLFGVTVEEISQRLEDFNRDVQGGVIKKGRFRFSLRIMGKLGSIQEVEEITLKETPGGRVIKLKDIARISDSTKERKGITRFNGRENIAILVRKEGGANTVGASRLIHHALEEIRRNSPAVDIHVVYEQAGYIEQSISSVSQALFFGSILAFLVLVLFLREIITPSIIAIVIPISVSATLNLLYFQNITLNVMSLGGLALGVGMLVDNSIVVSESIFRHSKSKIPPSEAALEGTREVGTAVTASTLTTISVFFPVLYVQGIEGQFFKDQAISVASALISSLAVSLTLLPTLASLRPVGRNKKKRFNFFSRISFRYHCILLWCLENKGKVFAGSLAFLLLTSGLAVHIPREFLPKPAAVSFTVELKVPANFSLEQTADIAAVIEHWLEGDGNTRSVFSEIGIISGIEIRNPDVSSCSARIHATMESPAQMDSAIQGLRRRLEKISGVSFSIDQEQATLAPLLDFFSSEIGIRIQGLDLARLNELALRMITKLKSVEGLVDIGLDLREGKCGYIVRAKKEALRRYGIRPEALNAFIVSMMRGRRGSQFEELDKRINILVRAGEGNQQNFKSFLDTLFLHRNSFIPLRELLDYRIVRGPREIRRVNQQREVLVTANLHRRKLGQVIPDIKEKIDELAPPPGYKIAFGRVHEEMRASFQSLAAASLLAVLLVYMIMAAQFESLLHPLLVLFSLPMGLTGAVWALFLTGTSLNVISVIGVIVLLGIVVNDAIVKVDCTNRLRKQGWEARDAILEASRIRLKPIVMTTMTTALGLFPLALGLGRGSELQKPLAIPLIGGLILATFLTLILIPLAYEAVEKRKQ